MAKLLIIAYKIEEGKGSEDASGYETVKALIARGHEVTLISRNNNIDLLRRNTEFAGVELVGLDVPAYLGWFKKGGRGVILYYYLWQIFVGRLVSALSKKTAFDNIHQLNFHTDWAPHFIRPGHSKMIWGPVMHHEQVPNDCIRARRFKTITAEYIRQFVKNIFWHCDPFLRRAVKRTDQIIYANKNLSPAFLSARSRMSFVPMGGASDLLSGEPDMTVEFNVLSTGRLVVLKGFNLTLEAFIHALNNKLIPESSHLTLIGSGPLEDELQARVNQVGMSSNITIVPWIDREKLSTYYEKASAFLYPSFESQGLVVGEAMGYGTPVIALENTGPAFLASDTGRIVPRGSFDEMVRGLGAALGEVAAIYTADEKDEYISLCSRVKRRFNTALLTSAVVDGIEAAYHKDKTRYVDLSIKGVRGLGPNTKYISLNGGVRFLPIISLFTGLRLSAEMICAKVQTLFPIKGEIANEEAVKPAVLKLTKLFPMLKRGLMLNTSWYKDTLMVGVVENQSELQFIKVFKKSSTAGAEFQASLKFYNQASDCYRLAKPKLLSDNVIAFDVIPYKTKETPKIIMLESAMQYALKTPLHDGSIELSFSLNEKQRASLVAIANTSDESISQVLSILDSGDRFFNYQLCHGDYTPWNAFIDLTGRLSLVDYERSCVRGQFTDAFHFVTQSIAMAPICNYPTDDIAEVVRLSKLDIAEIKDYYSLYLFEELLIDLNQWIGGKQHDILRNLIRNKWSLLLQVVNGQ